MKKILLAVLVLGVITVSCKESASSKVKSENVEKAKARDVSNTSLPVVSFDKTVYDFGTINEGETVETVFVVKNTGKSDLVITNASATCGCTIPSWPKEPVKVGESAEIKVKFNSRGKRNRQSKDITLTTNTLKGKEIIKIKGFVTPKNK